MNFKTQINKRVSLQRNDIKTFFQDVTKKWLVTNNSSWKLVRSFLTDKNCHARNNFLLVDNGKQGQIQRF